MTTALNGYSAKLTGAALDAVLADPSVDYVTEDSIYSINNVSTGSPTTGPASRARAVVDEVGRRDGPNGQGVDVYILGETLLYTG